MHGRSVGRPALAVLAALALALSADPVAAHVGSLGGAAADSSIPTWLVVMTGGVIVGGSFLFTSLLTDHGAIRAVNAWGVDVPTPASIRTAAAWAVRLASLGLLGLVVTTGLFGPPSATVNFAILFVWAGWWAGYTMSVYLLANTWPLVNPWRTMAAAVPRVGDRTIPANAGTWGAIAGLLGLVWLEVVSPVAQNPRFLAAVIAGYSVVTLSGAAVFGAEAWFRRVDPIARVFRTYGRMAPLARTDDGLQFRLPSARLASGGTPTESGQTAFVVALLWVTTYDGLVTTPEWAAVVRSIAGVGVPPLAVYLAAILGGYGLFLLAYRLSAAKVRESADSYVTAEYIQRWFVPSLLPIAAGYHVAHFLGYLVTLSPALLAVAASPFDPPATVTAIVLPGWFDTVQLGFILLGHMLAVWVAHATSFELFPGILKPVRSQYPLVAVMICYTMTSMWIVSRPYTQPPFIAA